MVKIGRRGSLNADITVHGTQGHVAYPQRADNPVHRLIAPARRADRDAARRGHGRSSRRTWRSPASTSATPPPTSSRPRPRARLNIRFNDQPHRRELSSRWLRGRDRRGRPPISTSTVECPQISGEAFLTEPGPFTDWSPPPCATSTGRGPELSTTGGTSDARFIRALCPVVEFGLVGATMHQVDERVDLTDIEGLTRESTRPSCAASSARPDHLGQGRPALAPRRDAARYGEVAGMGWLDWVRGLLALLRRASLAAPAYALVIADQYVQPPLPTGRWRACRRGRLLRDPDRRLPAARHAGDPLPRPGRPTAARRRHQLGLAAPGRGLPRRLRPRRRLPAPSVRRVSAPCWRPWPTRGSSSAPRWAPRPATPPPSSPQPPGRAAAQPPRGRDRVRWDVAGRRWSRRSSVTRGTEGPAVEARIRAGTTAGAPILGRWPIAT